MEINLSLHSPIKSSPQRGICSLPTVTVRAAALLSGVPARCHIPAVHKAFRYLQEIRTRRKRRGLRR